MKVGSLAGSKGLLEGSNRGKRTRVSEGKMKAKKDLDFRLCFPTLPAWRSFVSCCSVIAFCIANLCFPLRMCLVQVGTPVSAKHARRISIQICYNLLFLRDPPRRCRLKLLKQLSWSTVLQRRSAGRCAVALVSSGIEGDCVTAHLQSNERSMPSCRIGSIFCILFCVHYALSGTGMAKGRA